MNLRKCQLATTNGYNDHNNDFNGYILINYARACLIILACFYKNQVLNLKVLDKIVKRKTVLFDAY